MNGRCPKHRGVTILCGEYASDGIFGMKRLNDILVKEVRTEKKVTSHDGEKKLCLRDSFLIIPEHRAGKPASTYVWWGRMPYLPPVCGLHGMGKLAVNVAVLQLHGHALYRQRKGIYFRCSRNVLNPKTHLNIRNGA